jgi:hypothetical protein
MTAFSPIPSSGPRSPTRYPSHRSISTRDLRITDTPQHPETELRNKGALYESSTRISDVLANHWVIDGNLVTGQNQNAGPMVAREMLRLARQRLSGGDPTVG